MALTDLTRISTSGIATGSTIDAPILRKDVSFRGTQVGVTSALFDSSDDALEFNDNVKLKFGNDGDLEVYHNGADSYIDVKTGSLYFRNTFPTNTIFQTGNFTIKNQSNNQTVAIFAPGANGGGKLYHENDLKFQTTQTGAVVTGILTATSFSGPVVGNTSNASGISTFYDLRVSNNLTVEGTTTTLDTNLIGVDRVEVGADSNTIVGVAVTQSGTADLVNLFDGASQVVTVDDEGNVGLGINSPSTKLQVHGGLVKVSGHAYARVTVNDGANEAFFGFENQGPLLIGNANADAQIRVQGTNDIFFQTGNTVKRLTIKGDTGNVGINSTAPTATLDVNGVGIITAGIKINTSPAITIRDGTTEKGYIGFYANDPFIGRKNGVGLLFQDNKVRPVDGDTGIGTNNTVSLGEPTYKFKDLYLEGDIHIDSDVGQLRIGADEDLKIDHNGSNGFLLNGTGGFYHRSGGHIFENANGATEYARIASDGVITAQKSASFGNTSDSFTSLSILASTSGISELRFGDTTANAGYVKYEHNGNNLIFATNATPRLRINSSGHVGIGTDNPTDILDINSDQASAVSDVYIRNHATLGGAALNIWTQGTYTSPTYKAIIGCSDAGGTIRMGAASNHDLLLLTNNTPRVTITTSGRVGINTTLMEMDGVTGNLNIANDNFNNHTVINLSRNTAADRAFIRFSNPNGNIGSINTFGSDFAIYASNNIIFGASNAEKLVLESGGTLFSKSPSDATPNFKFISDDTNWHGYLNQTVHGSTISTILSCGGTWTVDGTTYDATKDYNGSFSTGALVIHNQYNGSQTNSELVFLSKANGSSTTDGAVSERLRITSAGDLKISTADKGIDFSAQTAASSGSVVSEVMNHFSTGTIGITLKAGSNTVPLYNNTARYTRIGNICFISIWIRVNGSTVGSSYSSSDTLKLTGLPFAGSGNSDGRTRMRFNGYSFASVTDKTWGWLVIQDGATTTEHELHWGVPQFSTIVAPNGTNIHNASAEIYINGHYFV